VYNPHFVSRCGDFIRRSSFLLFLSNWIDWDHSNLSLFIK
jgi:hypothetical protein